MEYLAYDPVSGALLTRRLASGKPLVLLCHSPAASLAAHNDDGSWPFAGYRTTGLSNAEERLNTFGWKAPWYLEDRLKENGADYSKALLPLRSSWWSTGTSTPARTRSPPRSSPRRSSPTSARTDLAWPPLGHDHGVVGRARVTPSTTRSDRSLKNVTYPAS